MSLATPSTQSNAIAPKDVTIVIDRSGSMHGEPMPQAKLAAVDMISRLDAGDRINVIAFSDEVDPLFQMPQPLGEARQHAIDIVEGLRESGGTDIGLALSPVGSTWLAYQDAQRDQLAARIQTLPGPLVVMRDFNATSWSAVFRGLVGRSGLCDSRAGFGLQASWPASLRSCGFRSITCSRVAMSACGTAGSGPR